jgi:hypothetical protein
MDNDGLAVMVSPNPAKEKFNLDYTLKKQSSVNVDLYNSIGVKMKTIYSGKQMPGKQLIPVEIAKDGLSAGVYFISVSLDGDVTTKQLIIIQ